MAYKLPASHLALGCYKLGKHLEKKFISFKALGKENYGTVMGQFEPPSKALCDRLRSARLSPTERKLFFVLQTFGRTVRKPLDAFTFYKSTIRDHELPNFANNTQNRLRN